MSRSVEVYFLPAETDENTFAGHTAIVVDLLRASTTIITALANGAREVIPAESPERAVSLRDEIGKVAVRLCGERGGEMIPGFDMGNSPREYTRDAIANRILLFASSNGSKAILAASEAEELAVGALINAAAVVQWAAGTQRDCVILCAGKQGEFSGEDAACAGYLVSLLGASGYTPGNDGARAVLAFAKEAQGDWLAFVKATDHGQYLMELGYGADFPVVVDLNRVPVVPILRDNKLVLQGRPVEVWPCT